MKSLSKLLETNQIIMVTETTEGLYVEEATSVCVNGPALQIGSFQVDETLWLAPIEETTKKPGKKTWNTLLNKEAKRLKGKK